LPEVGFPAKKINNVLEAIRLHDNYNWDEDGEKTDHVETMVIQDADRIELLGAIGIARLSYYFGEKGYPIYSDKDIPMSGKVWLNHSLVDQIKRDPIKKWKNMNFTYSRKISKGRYLFLIKFYNELKKEFKEHHGG